MFLIDHRLVSAVQSRFRLQIGDVGPILSRYAPHQCLWLRRTEGEILAQAR